MVNIMKKLLICTYCLFIGLGVMAGNIKVKNGTPNFVKENVCAIISFDFTNTRWEDRDSFREWSGKDYETRVEVASKNFVISFNENTKGLKLIESKDDAKYTIVFVVDNLERHQAFTGMWGQGKISVTGTITVIDISTNTTVCSMLIDGYGASKDYVITDAIGKCFKSLGKEITKIK